MNKNTKNAITTTLTTLALLATCGVAPAAEDALAGKLEGKLDTFLGGPKFAL